MFPHVFSFAQPFGVLAQTRERFQLIAMKLDATCVWLSDPAASAEGISTVIIDSDLLLSADADVASSFVPVCSSGQQAAVASTRLCILSGQGDVVVAEQCAQLTHLKACGRPLQRVSHPQCPSQLLIYQCADQED